MAVKIAEERAWYGPLEYVMAALILGLMGIFFWAIRGTGGYGGSAGGMLAGLGWAMLWYGFSRHGGQARNRPYGTGHIIAAIMLGITVGGMTGYGVYVSWVRGDFLMGVTGAITKRPVNPLTGFAMMFFCGLHWGGVTGAFMVWCAPQKTATKETWALRIGAGVAGAIIAYFLAAKMPQLFLPFYSEGIYNEANRDCVRAAGSIKNIMPHVGAYVGFLVAECIRKDWRAVKVMLIMGLGFATAFTLGAFWHRADSIAHSWKFWEMSIGFGGGISFGLVFYLFNQADGKKQPYPITTVERYVAMGLVVLLGIANIASNTYEGFSKLHELELPGLPRLIITLGFVIAAVIIYLWWQRESEGHSRGDALLPGWVMFVVLEMIIISGYLISLPQNVPSNATLLTIYTICIFASAGLFGILEFRRRV